MIECARHTRRGKEKVINFFINSIVDLTKTEKTDETKLNKES